MGCSCGGCETAVLDIDGKILDVTELMDIVFWPVTMDIKYKDVENISFLILHRLIPPAMKLLAEMEDLRYS